ncbi:DNA-protecting protein DprA [Bordetella hinzii]|uniref:DNA-processing protein DprA n=1 Tax=Bordetella hinzii TaxID=103855 RepID=UPI0013EFCB75|nr:DNA-processing protein DprA [Bordetella hinzii]QII83472.1 DNA-protecting protein DprA [Bordetella hinzii]
MPLQHDSEELAAWLRLSLEPGVGPVTACGLLRAFGLPQALYAQSASALARQLPQPLAIQLAASPAPDVQALVQRGLEWVADDDHYILTLADPAYPQSLLSITDPPVLLYVKGRPELLNRPTLAVVGARNATPMGTQNARAFARHLAAHGWCVASGLALGIDAAAHEGALAAGPGGGGTVAVLGTGVDRVYPAGNRRLAHAIAAGGALVSEFALGTGAQAHHFPQRNRLVAGLSRGVLVVEAARQSGSLITARLAGEGGREVFAIPGSIHSPLSRGCHALIRQGAKLVETAQDITDELGSPQRPPRPPAAAPAAPPQSAALDALGYDPQHLDALTAGSGIDAATLAAQLTELEIEGWVARLDDGRYQRLK